MRRPGRASARARRAVVGGALAGALALAAAACTGGPTPPPTSPAPAAPATPSPTAPADARATVRTTVRIGSLTLTLIAPAGAQFRSTRDDDGSVQVTVRGLDPGDTVRLVAPDGDRYVVQADRSATVERSATPSTTSATSGTGPTDATAGTGSTTVVAGLAPPRTGTSAASGAVAGVEAADGTTDAPGPDRVLTVTTDERALTLWFGTGEPRSAVWGDHDGGRSLAVDPSAWARAAGVAGWTTTWSALTTDHPDANTPGMHDQLVCHALGAPDKPTWNLEPWRTDVGLPATIAAACNPS